MFPVRFFFLLLLLLLVLVDDDAFVDCSTNGPYSDPAQSSLGLTFRIDSPPQLKGVLTFLPFLNSRSPLSSSASGSLSGRVVLPNSNDPLTGCDHNGNPVLFTDRQDNGETFDGTILLAMNGVCYTNFSGLPILAAIVVNPQSYSTVLFDGSVAYLTPILVPIVLSDITIVLNYLRSNLSSVAPVYATITGTGPLVAEEATALRTIAAKMQYQKGYTANSESVFGRTASSLFPYPTSSSYDPCVSDAYMGGIYCQNGHIVFIFFNALGLVGSLPSEFGAFTQLRYFGVYGNSISGALPSAICNWTNLIMLSVSRNKITELPDCFDRFTQLTTLSASTNAITSFPNSILRTNATLQSLSLSHNMITFFPSVSSMSALISLALNSNNASGTIFSFQGMKSITTISLRSNRFSGLFDPSWLDNLTSLTYIDLSLNNIEGPPPALMNSTNVQTLLLDWNSFSGPCPSSWSHLVKLVTLTASHNQLTYGVNSNNPLLNAVSLSTLDLSYNLISAPSSYFPAAINGGFALFLGSTLSNPKLSTLKLDGNYFYGDWHPGAINGVFFPMISVLSLSHNNISSIPYDLFSQPVPLVYVDVSYNALTGALPVVGPNSNATFISFIGNPQFIGALPSWLSLSSSSFLSSALLPYACPQIQSPSNLGLTVLLDDSYTQFAGCVCEHGYYGSLPSCLLIPPLVSLVQSMANFSDNDFGQQRYSSGLDSSWLISPGPSTRVISLSVTFFPLVFNSLSDQLTIFDGNSSLSPVAYTWTGSEGFAATSSLSSSSSGQQQQQQQHAQYTQVVSVIGSAVLVNFRSKKPDAQQFIVQYETSNECPAGFVYFSQTDKCYEVFTVQAGYQIVVYVFSALVSFFILFLLFIMLKHRNSLIVRTASVPFCIMILIFLLAMSIGSIFFAMQPSVHGASVCHLRAWFTGSSVIGVLAALITKANRIRQIFNNNQIKEGNISNKDLARTILTMNLIEVLLLIVYSSLPSLSSPLLTVNASSQRLLTTCPSASDNVNALIWTVVQFGYVTLFLCGALFIAFGTRKAPSAFNESSHIMHCLECLLTLGFIVVLVQYIIEDDPSSLIVLRGLGQSLITLVLSLAIFGPKLYFILDRREDDKSMIYTKSMLGSGAPVPVPSNVPASKDEREVLSRPSLSASKDTFDSRIQQLETRMNQIRQCFKKMENRPAWAAEALSDIDKELFLEMSTLLSVRSADRNSTSVRFLSSSSSSSFSSPSWSPSPRHVKFDSASVVITQAPTPSALERAPAHTPAPTPALVSAPHRETSLRLRTHTDHERTDERSDAPNLDSGNTAEMATFHVEL